MKTEIVPRLKPVPPIVSIVLTQATRRRANGGITAATFEDQIRRITREELEPKGLVLLKRELPGGRTRFIIKENATGTVCDLIDCDPQGMPEPDPSDPPEPVTPAWAAQPAPFTA